MITQQNFKDCMSKLASSVSVAVTKSQDYYTGVTINTFCSLSLDPLLVLFNLKKESFCYDDFVKSQTFAVNILSEFQEDISNIFTKSISKKQWDQISHSNENLPCFKESVSYIECKTKNIYDGGSHSIIVGEVIQIKEMSHHNPLIYYNRNYHKLSK